MASRYGNVSPQIKHAVSPNNILPFTFQKYKNLRI